MSRPTTRVATLILLGARAFPGCDFAGELIAGLSAEQVVETAKRAHRLPGFVSDSETIAAIVNPRP